MPDGYLASITSPPFNGNSAVTTFAYDSFNRVRTVTDSDGYAVTTDYDNLDRKTKMTYPDSTFEQFQYTDNVTGAMTLDLTGSRDRRGLWTYRHYNANRQMDSITDPANRTTHYGWCNCGALESITDPKLQITTFYRDIQSRVYQKVFNDGTTINYLYEGQTAPNTAGATSRLKSSTDAKNQRTNYSYFADDNLAQITYTDTSGQPLNPPTPSVSYTYDPNYNRVLTMVDGSGTTVYGYNPVTVPPVLGANRLASIDGALPNDTITFSYDELGPGEQSEDQRQRQLRNLDVRQPRAAEQRREQARHLQLFLRRCDRSAPDAHLSGRDNGQLHLFSQSAGQAAPADQEPDERERAPLAVRLHLRHRRPAPHLDEELSGLGNAAALRSGLR